MDRRRLTGLIALVVLVVAVGALVFFGMRAARQGPTTAFAPAASSDESVAPPDEKIVPPADVAAAPAVEPPASAQSAAPTVTTEAPAGQGTQVATAPATSEAAPPATTAMPPVPPVPSFDVVRVEPSGEAVIAGQAEANATVEVLDGPTVIATAQANDRGEWVIALDKPLPPGAHDLAVRTTSPDKTVATLSDQRVTVSVPEGGTSDVLVVLNTPNGPSTILQVPPPAPGAPAEPGADQQAAVNAPAVPAAGETKPAAVGGAAPAAPAETSVASGEVTPAPSEQVAALEGQAGEAPAGAEPQVAAEAPIQGEPPVAGEAPAAAVPQVASNAPTAQPAAPPPPPEPKVVVAAVEADTAGSLYIAGTVTTGETVRVYIDGAPVGDAAPSPSGTWLIETVKDMPAGNYVVRADQIDAGGNVIARSEVPFEREVEVASLKPTGVTASAAGATLAGTVQMETVIIKRGDNLWRIARAAWGKGIRWSTIYQANNDQIRNPHWIYPGQVFVMPKGDAAWQN
jgi:nucleoid-associated protein YgaU